MNKPIPFDPTRRPRPRRPLPQSDRYAEILEEIAAISDCLDGLADLVIRLAAREGRRSE